LTGTLNGYGHQRKRGQMDWIKELKDWVGITDEGYAADLNDVEEREILTEEHLECLKETASNTDVADLDSTV